MYELSIVIPTRNRADALLKAILGIEQATHISHEIIVIDSASTDATNGVLMLAGSIMSKRLRVIRESTNLGFAAACNKGVAIARGRYLCVLHDDVHPIDRALDQAVDELDLSGDDDLILALATDGASKSNIGGGSPADFPVARRQTFANVPLDVGFRSGAAIVDWSLRAKALGSQVRPIAKPGLRSHVDKTWEDLTASAERNAIFARAAAKPRSGRKAA